MLNITTIENGFNFNNTEYLFKESTEIISDTQCHVITDKGVILLDLTCTINNVDFTDINSFVQALGENA